MSYDFHAVDPLPAAGMKSIEGPERGEIHAQIVAALQYFCLKMGYFATMIAENP